MSEQPTGNGYASRDHLRFNMTTMDRLDHVMMKDISIVLEHTLTRHRCSGVWALAVADARDPTLATVNSGRHGYREDDPRALDAHAAALSLAVRPWSEGMPRGEAD